MFAYLTFSIPLQSSFRLGARPVVAGCMSIVSANVGGQGRSREFLHRTVGAAAMQTVCIQCVQCIMYIQGLCVTGQRKAKVLYGRGILQKGHCLLSIARGCI